MRPELSADVLAQKAREILRTLGYTDRPRDEAYEFFWDTELTGHIAERDTAPVNWARIATVRPSPLAFWYRRADEPMIAESFHHDLLTPGIVTQADPAPIRSGMMSVQLDHFGWLTAFEAIPPQEETKAVTPAAIDWAAVFKLAGLDPATLTPATPQRNWLSNPDARAAWTGIWPDSNRPLRIEAGTRGGQLTAFRVLGPWNAPERSASPSDSEGIVFITVLFILVLAIIVGGGLLARKNLREGRGDRTSAFRLACLVSAALWLLWICQGHFPATPGMIGIFLLAVCTTVSYSVLFWAVYLALEPFVRRHWPQTLVSWTTLLSGRLRDPIVGRDVLIGAAIGVATAVFIRIAERFSGQPVLVDNEVLTGSRAAAGAVVSVAIYSVRSALLVFYLLFLLRVVLRNQWIAAVALVFLFTALNFFEPGEPVVKALVTLVYFSLLAVAVLRWGLTSLAVALLTANLLMTAPVTTDRSAWFIVSAAAIGALPLALATWAFFVSAPGASRARRAGMFDA